MMSKLSGWERAQGDLEGRPKVQVGGYKKGGASVW